MALPFTLPPLQLSSANQATAATGDALGGGTQFGTVNTGSGAALLGALPAWAWVAIAAVGMFAYVQSRRR